MSTASTIASVSAEAAYSYAVGRAIGDCRASERAAWDRVAHLERQLSASRENTSALEEYVRALEARVYLLQQKTGS